MDERRKAHCNSCTRVTNHAIVERRVVNDEDLVDDDVPYWWTDTYEMLQCLGCNAVCLRKCTKEASGATTEVTYPPAVSRRPPRWRWHLPEPMKELLAEIYAALYSDSRRLALMGARTLVDMLMREEVGDRGTFAGRLLALRDKGVISEPNRDVLDVALDAGNAAAHRDYKPDREALEAVLDIVENVLQATHHLGRIAEDLRKRTPPRPTVGNGTGEPNR